MNCSFLFVENGCNIKLTHTQTHKLKLMKASFLEEKICLKMDIIYIKAHIICLFEFISLSFFQSLATLIISLIAMYNLKCLSKYHNLDFSLNNVKNLFVSFLCVCVYASIVGGGETHTHQSSHHFSNTSLLIFIYMLYICIICIMYYIYHVRHASFILNIYFDFWSYFLVFFCFFFDFPICLNGDE